MSGGKSGAKSASGSKSQTRSAKAGLQFPVGHIHLQFAIGNVEELNKLLDHITIAQSSVLPNIHGKNLSQEDQEDWCLLRIGNLALKASSAYYFFPVFQFSLLVVFHVVVKAIS